MAVKQHRSRIHLLAAKEAPTLVILQRKRAKLFHVVTVDAETHRIEEGSWFRGVLYVMRCDVSFDGKFMVYLAMGRPGPKTWSGLCRLPWLKTLAEAEGIGANWGGGYFADRDVLATNVWREEETSVSREIPFTLSDLSARSDNALSPFTSEDPGIFYLRMERDGFRRLGDNWGEERKLDTWKYQVACIGDDGWGNRPSPRHPELQVRYLGYLDHGPKFAFSLDRFPGLIDEANWVTWDSRGNLWVARPGIVEQYTLEDLSRGTPSFSLDVDRFEPPPTAHKPGRA
jgi:hypothetical protein